MKKNYPQKKQKAAGELRQDLITGKWVAIAPGRTKKPNDFRKERPRVKPLPRYKDDCPFCNLAHFPQEPDVVRLPDDPDTWQVHIFGNKYPAFLPREELRAWNTGPYRAIEAVGYHEILATRWHDQIEHAMPLAELELEVEALVMRYRQLKTKPSVNYIQIICNHGPEGGASLEHPHHQIFTLPVLPDDVHDLLSGAERYAATHQQDPFTAMLEFERRQGERVIWENEHFTILCPYASRVPFETWIMPRQPEASFENLDPTKRRALADSLKQIFARLNTGLNDPSYNYFIHSAPCDDTGFVCNRETFQHFRWHIEIMPRFSRMAGLELATGLEINTTPPEEAASFLRDIAIGKIH